MHTNLQFWVAIRARMGVDTPSRGEVDCRHGFGWRWRYGAANVTATLALRRRGATATGTAAGTSEFVADDIRMRPWLGPWITSGLIKLLSNSYLGGLSPI